MHNFSKLLVLILMPSIAIAANNPMQTAEAWAKAVQGRDGKKQYQLMCIDLQKANYDTLQSDNWVTGVSSPQVKTFSIEKGKQNKGTVDYLVKYQMIAGGEIIGSVTDQLQVKNGCISGFKYLSPSDADPTQ